MRRFLQLSISLLCLSLTALITFHLGYRTASADFENSGQIVGLAQDHFLLSDGSTYTLDAAGMWKPHPPIPVSVTEIKFWDWDIIVTQSDMVWHVLDSEWVQTSPPGPTAVQPSTWGHLKSRYGN